MSSNRREDPINCMHLIPHRSQKISKGIKNYKLDISYLEPGYLEVVCLVLGPLFWECPQHEVLTYTNEHQMWAFSYVWGKHCHEPRHTEIMRHTRRRVLTPTPQEGQILCQLHKIPQDIDRYKALPHMLVNFFWVLHLGIVTFAAISCYVLKPKSVH